MEKTNLKFVIVGHVDHGKSTLIGRLLYDTNSLPPDRIEEIKKSSKELGRDTEFAFLMDHFQEEREQGITIDTTQTFFKTKGRQYVIIDAPGHVEFVKNMITGASQAEAALLIVDINEGMQEQTKRHAYLLSLLGLRQIIVVVNKMDLVGYNKDNFKSLSDELAKFLDSLGLKAKLYIPISAIRGENIIAKSEQMPWYQGPTVLEGLDALENMLTAQELPMIFPVQDIYVMDSKRIYVGRVETGTIKNGQQVKVLPSQQITKIKSIEKFQENTNISFAGESIGVTTVDPVFMERGHVICEPENGPYLSEAFISDIFWLSKDTLTKNEKLVLKCATQEIICRIENIWKRIDSSSLKIIEDDADKLGNLEVGEITIKTKKPIVVTLFNQIPELGRFVLTRDGKICAGGIITSLISGSR